MSATTSGLILAKSKSTLYLQSFQEAKYRLLLTSIVIAVSVHSNKSVAPPSPLCLARPCQVVMQQKDESDFTVTYMLKL